MFSLIDGYLPHRWATKSGKPWQKRRWWLRLKAFHSSPRLISSKCRFRCLVGLCYTFYSRVPPDIRWRRLYAALYFLRNVLSRTIISYSGWLILSKVSLLFHSHCHSHLLSPWQFIIPTHLFSNLYPCPLSSVYHVYTVRRSRFVSQLQSEPTWRTAGFIDPSCCGFIYLLV